MMRRHPADIGDDDGAGYLISVSDMMAGLLFVFLITLVAFVINFRIATDEQRAAQEDAVQKKEQAILEKERAETERDAAETEKERLESVRDDLTNARRLRTQMLDDIRERLEARGIRVEIDHDNGVLRLSESAISFESSRAELRKQERRKLAQIGAVLMEVLPCYAANGGDGCATLTLGKLEAVFIEGHTDNVPLQGGHFRDNWDLSAQRAMYTYRLLAGREPGLPELRNKLGQPLFSVSGYGAGRPVIAHQKPTNEPRNRRIDLRFIMTPPPATQEPAPVRALRQRGLR
ncbi:MAG: OmpA family protein [Thiohalocapsa sp.]|uniref:OmpA/MotB family protein n=1 Tax=Thiohalocapsa sp. TaxID=2497641 RepID=UPI0025CDF09E|nr:OmpA family protein [Thiohalocapsa sp.]MCG6942098.1 OmpA family protein [Thiohalocapsa sp.]